MGYRKTVILDNLSKSDISVSAKERDVLLGKIYKNLTDIIIEGIKSFTMSRKQILRRHKLLNPELVEPYFKAGKSLIIVTGHYCNWEWGSLSAGLQTPYNIVAFYKPLNNRWVDWFMRWSRSRYGTTLAPIYETTKTFENFKNTPTIYLMAADQSPAKADKAYWIDFLGRKTAFLHGPEKHARNNNIDVLFVEIQRLKRGKYEMTLSLVAENPGKFADGEISSCYAKKLETVIRANPANWLWSHRRWKLTR
jgi:KDO2-lipid IV(A) lauroyltransferase